MQRILTICLSILIVLSLCGICPAAADGFTLVISQPSVQSTAYTLPTVCQGRDFYVVGSITGNFKHSGSSLEVKLLDAHNKAVRTLSSQSYCSNNLYTDYEQLSYYDDDISRLAASGMPELIYDPDRDNSFTDGNIKCWFNNKYFYALICGGTLSSALGLTDNGVNFEQLEKGIYQISVTLTDGNGAECTANKQMQIADSENKLISRFSPAAHFSRAREFADKNGFTCYTDLFPGYWDCPESNTFAEILPSWHNAEFAEYSTGTAHYIAYNVKKSSATYSIELASLQLSRSIDSRLKSYYYKNGETDSEIVPFASNDRLQLTRAERVPNTSEDNIYNTDTPDAISVDNTLSDGVKAAAGESVAIYGVTAPFQLDSGDITQNNNGSYSLNNKIATIQYTISVDGYTESFERSVGMQRVSDGWSNPSEPEFRHVIDIENDWAGKTVSLTMCGYDAHGTKISGTTEQLSIFVADSPQSYDEDDSGTQQSTIEDDNPDTGAASPCVSIVILTAAAFTIFYCRRHE